MPGLELEQIWRRIGGAASIGYHVRHAIGSLDRLFTYARAETLSREQLAALTAESGESALDAEALVDEFERAVDVALAQLRATTDESLFEARFVGRAQLPSTVMGLLFHAAEHTQRHVGQMITTAKLVRALG